MLKKDVWLSFLTNNDVALAIAVNLLENLKEEYSPEQIKQFIFQLYSEVDNKNGEILPHNK